MSDRHLRICLCRGQGRRHPPGRTPGNEFRVAAPGFRSGKPGHRACIRRRAVVVEGAPGESVSTPSPFGRSPLSSAYSTIAVTPPGILGRVRHEPGMNVFWGRHLSLLSSASTEKSPFAQGTANEHRQTLGTRLLGRRGGFDWDIEAAFQFGSFGSARYSSLDRVAGYRIHLHEFPASPRLGLKADVISGDGNLNDNRLETFNALFRSFHI